MPLSTAHELAARVRAGQISAREAVDEALRAIDRLNPTVNAFVSLCAERARAEADAIGPGDARPLAGVPIGVKDAFTMVEGLPLTMGSEAIDVVPGHDDAYIRRLRAAGAVVLGRTNAPEFAMRPVTEPRRYGPTRNPWDTTRTPGGSSGGSAAAVAAGMVPLATGNDAGGSIRVPASCCGLVGLKPSRGRVSSAPAGEFAAGFATEGMLARTVRDAALALDVIARPELGDPYWAPPPAEPFERAAGRGPGKLRIGFTIRAPNGADVDPECATGVERAMKLAESLGHRVEEATPDWVEPRYGMAFGVVLGTAMKCFAKHLGELQKAPIDPEKLEPASRGPLAMPLPTADVYVEALEFLRVFSRRLLVFWEDHDLFVTPSLAKPPPVIGTVRPEDPLDFAPFGGRWNVTGQPAISLPVHWTPAGLPVGVQFVGPPAGEAMLLAFGAQLERELRWDERRPPP